MNKTKNLDLTLCDIKDPLQNDTYTLSTKQLQNQSVPPQTCIATVTSLPNRNIGFHAGSVVWNQCDTVFVCLFLCAQGKIFIFIFVFLVSSCLSLNYFQKYILRVVGLTKSFKMIPIMQGRKMKMSHETRVTLRNLDRISSLDKYYFY